MFTPKARIPTVSALMLTLGACSSSGGDDNNNGDAGPDGSTGSGGTGGMATGGTGGMATGGTAGMATGGTGGMATGGTAGMAAGGAAGMGGSNPACMAGGTSEMVDESIIRAFCMQYEMCDPNFSSYYASVDACVTEYVSYGMTITGASISGCAAALDSYLQCFTMLSCMDFNGETGCETEGEAATQVCCDE